MKKNEDGRNHKLNAPQSHVDPPTMDCISPNYPTFNRNLRGPDQRAMQAHMRMQDEMRCLNQRLPVPWNGAPEAMMERMQDHRAIQSARKKGLNRGGGTFTKEDMLA